ncbi:phosphocholine cytidylyltransferase family protein [Streptomyces arenae]|nr:phosphocholine cytidylyltransferase family protein [Streptomyces arenae]
MRGIILAAGRGSRMGSLTDDRPKCLLEHHGRRLLDRQLAALRRAGVSQTAVVTGWQAARFDELALAPFQFHNAGWEHSSMVDSLACAEPWLSHGPCVISYGDIVFTPDAARAVAAASGEIAVGYDPQWEQQWSSRFTDPLSDAETFRVGPGSRVTDIGDAPTSTNEVEGQYMGLLKLSPDGWSAVKGCLAAARGPGARRDMTGLLGRIVRQGDLPVHAIPVPGPWHEFDSRSDLEVGRPQLDALDRLLWGDPLPEGGEEDADEHE